jgi:hypothetical protein
VFSIDSIVTAIGMAQDIRIMVAAVLIAVVVMYAASGPVARFVAAHPTAKTLALAFLVLIGVALVADGFDFHIPRGYIYFAMAFAAAVEAFNIAMMRRGAARRTGLRHAWRRWKNRPHHRREPRHRRQRTAGLRRRQRLVTWRSTTCAIRRRRPTAWGGHCIALGRRAVAIQARIPGRRPMSSACSRPRTPARPAQLISSAQR